MTTEQSSRAVATRTEERPTLLDQIEREMQEMRQRMSALMRRPFAILAGPALPDVTTWAPTADAYETAGSLVIKAELPGVKQEDIAVTVERGLLTIAGERSEEHEQKDAKRYTSERFRGSYSRSFALPDGVDVNAIAATYKDGVLDVRIPLPEQAKTEATSIPVKG